MSESEIESNLESALRSFDDLLKELDLALAADDDGLATTLSAEIMRAAALIDELIAQIKKQQ